MPSLSGLFTAVTLFERGLVKAKAAPTRCDIQSRRNSRPIQFHSAVACARLLQLYRAVSRLLALQMRETVRCGFRSRQQKYYRRPVDHQNSPHSFNLLPVLPQPHSCHARQAGCRSDASVINITAALKSLMRTRRGRRRWRHRCRSPPARRWRRRPQGPQLPV